MKANTQKIAESIEELVRENERLRRVIATVKEYLAAPRKTRAATQVVSGKTFRGSAVQQADGSLVRIEQPNGPQKQRRRRSNYSSDVEEVMPPQI